MWWENYQPAQSAPAPQKKKQGGLGGLLGGLVHGVTDFAVNDIVKPVIDSSLEGGRQLQNLQGLTPGASNQQRAKAKDFNLGKLAGAALTTDLAVAPFLPKGSGAALGAVKGASGEAAGIGSRIVSGAKVGSAFGGAQGLANSLSRGSSPDDYINNIVGGATAGGLLGAPLGAVAGKLPGTGKYNKAEPLAEVKSPSATPSSFMKKVQGSTARQGQQMEARSGGFAIGAKQAGQAPLGFYDSAKVSKTLANEGIAAGNPIARTQQVEDALGKYGGQIDQFIKTGNRPLSQAEKSSVLKQFSKAVETPNVSDTVRKNANTLSENFNNQVNTVEDLINFRRGLDRDAISYIRNPDASLAANQAAAKSLRGVVSDATSRLLPGIKEANTKYSQLADAHQYLVGGANSVNKAGGGLVNRLIESGPVQTAESKTGRMLQKLGGGVEKPLAAEAGAVAETAGKTPGRLLGAIDSLGSKAGVPAAAVGATNADQLSLGAAPEEDQGAADAALADLSAQQSASMQPEEQAPASQFSAEQLQSLALNDIATTGGKNLDKIATLDKLFGPSSVPASSKKPLSAEASKQVANASSGLRAISGLQSMIAKDPGVTNRNAAAGIPVIGNLIRGAAGTQDYEAAKNEIIDIISRSRSGAALTKEEIANYKKALPSFGDSEAVAQRKLARFQDYFGNILQGQQAGSPDYESAGIMAQ